MEAVRVVNKLTGANATHNVEGAIMDFARHPNGEFWVLLDSDYLTSADTFVKMRLGRMFLDDMWVNPACLQGDAAQCTVELEVFPEPPVAMEILSIEFGSGGQLFGVGPDKMYGFSSATNLSTAFVIEALPQYFNGGAMTHGLCTDLETGYLLEVGMGTNYTASGRFHPRNWTFRDPATGLVIAAVEADGLYKDGWITQCAPAAEPGRFLLWDSLSIVHNGFCIASTVDLGTGVLTHAANTFALQSLRNVVQRRLATGPYAQGFIDGLWSAVTSTCIPCLNGEYVPGSKEPTWLTYLHP
jgi:hypothetical protein